MLGLGSGSAQFQPQNFTDQVLENTTNTYRKSCAISNSGTEAFLAHNALNSLAHASDIDTLTNFVSFGRSLVQALTNIMQNA